MDAIQIYGGNCLQGQTRIQGSKNAVLPILAATLLIDGTCEIENCPRISDVHHMLRLMESLCCKIERDGHTLKVHAKELTGCDMPSDSVGVMRSSIMLLGALLARIGSVGMQYPGGCVIGKRPIDLHLRGLRKMGVTIEEREDGFFAETKGLTGAIHKLPFVSVGATENLVLAAVLAQGTTVIENAAREPEITALCDFLSQAGADIEGAGTGTLIIRGVEKLHEVSYRVPADRIVAGTYLAACLCDGGEVFLQEAPCGQLGAVMEAAAAMGAQISESEEGMLVVCKGARRMPPMIRTQSYPGFPTDLQSAFLVAMALADGERGTLEETIFENRFHIVGQLQKMGAKISYKGHTVSVEGVKSLQGNILQADELRGGAALVLAGSAANGGSIVQNRHFIERGYEDICQDLRAFGVKCEALDY
ncbi:MAG: UDP-N-acetylglucosamine 1-carboxyvinyltransferase [Blautia sp.]|nr:UDP-N-acetylglucosamine 1-carboxyvinyltransferase [Lachnoclostridium sp.]MCM1210498.1 UDP-N-acetylglucosamine 1-carboxyvinyltransferase [Blautia sp.]